MKTVEIFKASETGGKSPEPVLISIAIDIDRCTGPISSNDRIKEIFDSEAEKLSDALLGSLPQGTIERLVICLMKRYVTIRHGIF